MSYLREYLRELGRWPSTYPFCFTAWLIGLAVLIFTLIGG